MKFETKAIEGNDTVSKDNPLKIFIQLILGLLVVIISSILILKITVATIIHYIPHKIDQQLGEQITPLISAYIKNTPETLNDTRRVQAIVDGLVEKSALKGNKIIASIVDNKEELNAYAWPGHRISVTRALFDKTDNENELAAVISHEIGHIFYKDNLRALGDAFVLTGVFSALTLAGFSNDLSNLTGSALNLFELKYSRAQEEKADKFGLDLINKCYGHVEGFVSVFQKLDEQERKHYASFPFLSLLSTHPQTKTRIEYIQEWSKEENFKEVSDKPLESFHKKKEANPK